MGDITRTPGFLFCLRTPAAAIGLENILSLSDIDRFETIPLYVVLSMTHGHPNLDAVLIDGFCPKFVIHLNIDRKLSDLMINQLLMLMLFWTTNFSFA